MKSPLPDYLAARRAWQSRWDDLAAGRQNWRVLSSVLIGLVVFQSIVLWQLATRAQVLTYAIEVDRFGQTRYAGPVQAKSLPEDQLWRWTLSYFVSHIRTIPSDPELLRIELLDGSAFLRGNALSTVGAYFNKRNPWVIARTTSVTVDPQVTVLKRSKNHWQLEWTEVHLERGGQRSEERWQALVSTLEDPPSKAGEGLQYINPFGLYVTELDWSLVRKLP
jgi:type IV secretory pathway TrbF-like protein